MWKKWQLAYFDITNKVLKIKKSIMHEALK